MGIFRSLFRSTRPASPRTAKPTLEALDERILLSTASASMHAVTPAESITSVVFYIGQDHCLYESDSNGSGRQVLTKGAVLTFSAGVGTDGYADCFIKEADNTFWEYTRTGGLLEVLPAGNNVGSFAACGLGEVYFQNWDHSLWEYSSKARSFSELSGPGTVQSIDAVTTYSAGDAVFALRGDGTFGEYTQTFTPSGNVSGWSYTQLSGAGTVQAGFSAGQTSWGSADVYVKAGDNSFWEWDGGWIKLDAPNTVKAFSAAADGQVDAIAANGWLVQYEQNGSRVILSSTNYGITEISVAVTSGVWSAELGTYNCYTNADNAGWYFTVDNQAAFPGSSYAILNWDQFGTVPPQ